MQSIKKLRKYQYDYHIKNYPYMNDWKKNPYTFLKARFYMEASAVFVYFLLKTKIKPNTITIIYGLAGILGCVLMAIPFSITHILAIILFFNKGILDWSDGHLARITNQTSVTGHVLDVYGARLNDLGFQIGLGFYVAFKTANPIFYYVIPLIPFFYAANLMFFSRNVIFNEILESDFNNDNIIGISNIAISDRKYKCATSSIFGMHNKYYKYFVSFLDDRARTVDLICFFILVEMFSRISITWIIFIAFIIKGFLMFIGGYYIIIKKGWVEKSLGLVISNIRNFSKNTE